MQREGGKRVWKVIGEKNVEEDDGKECGGGWQQRV